MNVFRDLERKLERPRAGIKTVLLYNDSTSCCFPPFVLRHRSDAYKFSFPIFDRKNDCLEVQCLCEVNKADSESSAVGQEEGLGWFVCWAGYL